MLSSLRRNGFVESLSVTKHNGSAVLLRRQLCATSNTQILNADLAFWRANGRLSARPLTNRFYSAPTSSDTAKNHGTPQPIPQAARKPKVELRPGPVKVARSTPSPAETSTASKVPAPATTPSAAPIPGADESSPIEVTKKDLTDAAQHGILAPPPEGAGLIRRLIHQGKELFKFYWRGLKLIETNRRRAKALRERVMAGGPPLTRAELRFVRRNKEDLLKLIPFALIILIAEEVIPLVVLYTPFLLPSTCIMPSQKQRIDAKRRTKQKATALEMHQVLELARTRLADTSTPMEASLDAASQIAFAGVFDLSTRGPTVMRLNRLKRHIATIVEDDALLKQEDFGKRLSAAELQEALDERGIITEGLPETAWSARLHWWLSQVETPGATDPVRVRLLAVASSATGSTEVICAPR